MLSFIDIFVFFCTLQVGDDCSTRRVHLVTSAHQASFNGLAFLQSMTAS